MRNFFNCDNHQKMGCFINRICLILILTLGIQSCGTEVSDLTVGNEGQFTPPENNEQAYGEPYQKESDVPAEAVSQQIVKGVVSLTSGGNCLVDNISVTDQLGNEQIAPVAGDCSFSVPLEVGQQYIINFAKKRQIVATLIFDTGVGGFSSYWLFLNEDGGVIDLGQVVLVNGVAIAEKNPLNETDQDGDGIVDLYDGDDDGDYMDDLTENDCDLDGIFHEEAENCDNDIGSAVGTVLEVKPRNDFEGAPHVNLSRKVRARFSCEIDRRTVTNETFKIESLDGSDTIDCQFKFGGTGEEGNKVICAHNEQPFLANISYSAIIDGVMCKDGIVVEKHSWSWKTRTAIELSLAPSKGLLFDNSNESPDAEDVFDDNNEISFMVIGDQGSGDENQKSVALAMDSFCSSNDCDFVVTAGDNFFPYCVNNMGPDDPLGLTDPQWKTKYKDMYGSLNIPFYPARGNHDCEAEFAYSQVDPLWRMEGNDYTVKIPGNTEQPVVEFFIIYPFQFDVIDTVVNEWLRNAIEESTAKWKILITHSPLISNGTVHGDDEFGLNKLIIPVICGKIDLVLSAHDRIFSHLKDTLYDCPVEQIVIGTGGYSLSGIDEKDPRVMSSTKMHGFGWFEIEDDKSLQFKMIKTDGSAFYITNWEKK